MKNKAIVYSFLLISLFCVAVTAQTVYVKPQWAKYEGSRVRYFDLGDKKSKEAIVFVHCWTSFRVLAGHIKLSKPPCYALDLPEPRGERQA